MERPRIFIVTQVAPYQDGPAGVHGVLGQASTALEELAWIAGLEPLPTSDVAQIPPEHLDRGGVLALFTIGETPWSQAQRGAIRDAVVEGRLAILGIHSATDACRDWDFYSLLLGARFDGHPWTQDLVVQVVDRTHPSTQHLDEEWNWKDEVYLFSGLRGDANVLLRVAPGQLDMEVPGAHTPACGFPLAWCFTEGRGRVFYTSLGHFPRAWESPEYLRHVQGGLSWVIG